MEFKMPLTYEQRVELNHLMEVAASESRTADIIERVEWLIVEIAYRRLLEGHRLTEFQRHILYGELIHASDVYPCLEPIADRLGVSR